MSFAEGTPTVEVVLGGKTYTVGYSWGGKRRAREQLARNGADPNKAHEEEYLSTLLWACLDREARASLSVEDVEDMIHPGNESEIGEKLRQLIVRGEPDEEPEGKNDQPEAATVPTSGTPSSRSGRLASTI